MKIQKSELNASIRDIPLPDNMRERPVSKKGYPVPFFACMVDGEWDFRVTSPERWAQCVKGKLCWVCGQSMGSKLAFVAGPMCVITRTSAEPPCHLSCATYSAIACPFLAMPKMRRNEADLPDGNRPPAGQAIMRNPGVTAVLVTKSFKVFKDHTVPNGEGGALIEMGRPDEVSWYGQRRHATREEIMASVEGGLPLLLGQCEAEKTDFLREDAKRELQVRIDAFLRWLPPATASGGPPVATSP